MARYNRRGMGHPEHSITRNEVEQMYRNFYALDELEEKRSFARVQSVGSQRYGGIDPRRRVEAADAGLIEEDHQAMANLSPNFIHGNFCEYGYTQGSRNIDPHPYISDVREGNE